LPHSITLDQNLGVVVVRYSGTVDYAEICDALDQMVRLPGFRAGLRLVADFRDSTTPLSGEEVRNLARYAKGVDSKWSTTKWALIASNDLTYGLARIYAAQTDDYQVTSQVFRDAREADDWLGLGVAMEQVLTRS
jgi:hypothetical protein